MLKGLTDIAGIKVGHVSDFDALTGCTVILCEQGAVAGGEIRGAASGSEEFETLNPIHVTPRIHAVVFTGGSAFGLEAGSGVRRYLEQKGFGFATGAARVPIVVTCVLYDLGIGKAGVRPGREMGEAAAAAASDKAVVEGMVGAGTGATVGKLLGMSQAMKSGIGTYTVELSGPYAGVKVSALAAVNAVGDVRDPATGTIVAGARGSRGGSEFADSNALVKSGTKGPLRENTTLVAVATNAGLSKVGANRLAQLAHLGMARTIQPVNLNSDGDTVIALSVGRMQAEIDALGVAAAEAVSQAILRAVRLAKTAGGVPGLAGS